MTNADRIRNMTESEAVKELQEFIDLPFGIDVSDEAAKLAIQALEKQIPKKAERKVIKYGKHKWRKDKNGEIDDFAFGYGYHNGVVCKICGESVCVHCNPDYDKLEDCEDDYYICPTCRDKFYSKRDYCSCGQKLDWSEE